MSNPDTTVYELYVSHASKLGNLSATIGFNAHIEGREALDTVVAWLREKGFEPTWQVYHAQGARGVMQKFLDHLAQFPVPRKEAAAEEAIGHDLEGGEA